MLKKCAVYLILIPDTAERVLRTNPGVFPTPPHFSPPIVILKGTVHSTEDDVWRYVRRVDGSFQDDNRGGGRKEGEREDSGICT